MKLKFKNQGFQESATAAVCDVFEGQPYHNPNVYTVDPGTGGHAGRVTLPVQGTLFGGELQQATLELPDDPPDVGYKNAEIELPLDVLRKNLHAVQDRQNLEHSMGGGRGATALPPADEGRTAVERRPYHLTSRNAVVVRGWLKRRQDGGFPSWCAGERAYESAAGMFVGKGVEMAR